MMKLLKGLNKKNRNYLFITGFFITAIIITFILGIKKLQLYSQRILGTNIKNIMGVPRGVKNNNPLNIRDSSSAWQGETGKNLDSQFEEFVSMAYGCRAGLKLLKNYVHDGQDNVFKIINRWAPAEDNNSPSSYLALVKKTMKDKFNLSIASSWCPVDKNGFTKLGYAMSCVELGSKYAPALVVWEQGYDMI